MGSSKLISLLLVAVVGIAIFRIFGNVPGYLYLGIVLFLSYRNGVFSNG